jgi:hypothetical protein
MGKRQAGGAEQGRSGGGDSELVWQMALTRLDVPPAVAAGLVVQAAELLETSPATLDHAIWPYERQQRPARGSEAAGCAVPDVG